MRPAKTAGMDVRNSNTIKTTSQLLAAVLLSTITCFGCTNGTDESDDGATGAEKAGPAGGEPAQETGGTDGTGVDVGTTDEELATASAQLCPTLCVSGTCTGNLCTEPEQLTINAYEIDHVAASGPVTRSAGARACAHSARSSAIHVLEVDGPCARVEIEAINGAPGNLPVDMGTLELDSPSLGNIEMLPDGPCMSMTATTGTLFTAGDKLTVSASGSGEIAPFNLVALAPETFTLNLSALHPGQPFTVSWAPGGPLAYVMVMTSSTTLFCRSTSASSLTVSGALTSALGQDSGIASVVAARLDSNDTAISTNGERAYFTASTSVQADVPYSP